MQKIIIYGHKIGTHTHSYIHNGFFRTFKFLGYETFWFDNDDMNNICETFDFSNCIFITEGQVCHKMPLRRDAIYFLHNCPPLEISAKKINFQYYTKDCINMEHISHGISIQDDCVFFPWGSHLLPHEFKEENLTNPRSNNVYFIGTVNNPQDNGNYQPIIKFAKACTENGHQFIGGGGYSGGKKNDEIIGHLSGWVSLEDEEKYSREAYMLPALQGENQLVNEMIPCRLFKAISFGNDGITNNPFAYDFFDHNVVFDKNSRELYFKAELAKMQPNDLERRKWLFNFVREKHTYINNINALMSMI